MRSDREGRNFIRPKSHRWKVIGGGLLALILLAGARDCYRFDDRAYADAYLPAAGGEIKVSLRGAYSGKGEERGSPYDFLVSYLSPDSTFERAELVSLSVRDAAGGKPVPVRADSAEHLRRTGSSYYWKSMNTPVADGNFAFGFRIPEIPLEYRDQVVSGRLRLIGAEGVREIPFTATLRTEPRQEMRSYFWDVVSGV